MTVTIEQQAALEQPVVAVAYFAEFDFKSAPVRVCNFNQNQSWGGHDWRGMGLIGSVSDVTESDGLESSPLNFTLSVADLTVLALAVGPVEEYRGRRAKMWMCPLDDKFHLVGDPVICWRGVMDMMTVGVDGGDGKIVLKCETSVFGLKRRPSLRMNAAQQKIRHPNDTGFAYQSDLISNPAVWLSRRFQKVD